MSSATDLDDWTDRLNPLLLRDVRQARGNWLTLGWFGLLLLFCWGISLRYLLAARGRILEEELGQQLFDLLYPLLLAGTGVITPFLAFQLAHTEARQETLELVKITALSAERILVGKVHAAFVLTLLQCSAVVPFLSLAYALGGLSLISVLGGLGFLLGNSYCLSQVGVACGLCGKSAWVSVLIALALVGGCGIASLLTWGCNGLLLEENFAVGLALGVLWCALEAVVGGAALGGATAELDPWQTLPRPVRQLRKRSAAGVAEESGPENPLTTQRAVPEMRNAESNPPC